MNAEPADSGRRMRATGRWLIAAGVAVWGVYGMWWLAGGEPEVVWFLPFHLAGVAPGAILSRWGASGLRRRRT